MLFENKKGVLINVGSRDEILSNSGSLNLIRENFLKTIKSNDGMRNL